MALGGGGCGPKERPQLGEGWGFTERSAELLPEPVEVAPATATSYRGFRCLIPAAPAVPAATANQHNDKYDDEKRGGIHVEFLLAVPCVFHFADALPQTNPFDPYPFL
jgi:hypothetical protein